MSRLATTSTILGALLVAGLGWALERDRGGVGAPARVLVARRDPLSLVAFPEMTGPLVEASARRQRQRGATGAALADAWLAVRLEPREPESWSLLASLLADVAGEGEGTEQAWPWLRAALRAFEAGAAECQSEPESWTLHRDRGALILAEVGLQSQRQRQRFREDARLDPSGEGPLLAAIAALEQAVADPSSDALARLLLTRAILEALRRAPLTKDQRQALHARYATLRGQLEEDARDEVATRLSLYEREYRQLCRWEASQGMR